MEQESTMQKIEGQNICLQEKTGKIGGYQADFITSIILLAFGLYVFWEGVFGMPLPTLSWDVWYTAPGVFPAFLGGMLVITSIMLGGKAIVRLRGQKLFNAKRFEELLKSKTAVRCYVAIGFLVIYIYGLLGFLPYIIATFVYLSANMLFFDKKQQTVKRIIFHLVTAFVAATAVAYIFENLAKIPLP